MSKCNTVKFSQREPIGSSTYPMPNDPVNYHAVMHNLSQICPEKDKVSTLYVHIPFCDQLCSFCGFNKFLSPEDEKDKYVDALIEEMTIYSETQYVQSLDIQAVYFGGGTPNSLSAEQLDRILRFINSNFPLSKDCEITCEGTPMNFTDDRVHALKSNGCNRVSAGIQTFNKEIRIEHLHMREGKEELLEYIEQIQKHFDNFNLDFIYNLPKQTDEIWYDDIETALKTNVKHLTLYPLVLLEKTPFYSDYVKKEKHPIPDQDREIDLFNWSLNRLNQTPFKDRYSVRDWCHNGYACKYIKLNAEANQVLAFGAGAHGYIAGMTYRNHRVLVNYGRETVEKSKLPLERHKLCSEEEIMQRYMVMGLRLLKRDMKPFQTKFDIDWRLVFGQKAEDMQRSGYITIDNDTIEFTNLGYTWANNVRTYFEGSKGSSVGYVDTVSIGKSGKDHYSKISRIKASADVEAHS